MEFKTRAQQESYQKVLGWMQELFSDYPWEKLDEPGVGICLGSAWVEVRIYPWQEDAIICSRSYVVSGAELSPDLLRFLLRTNTDTMFGGFSIDGDGNIVFEHNIVGSTCDPNELEESVLAVLETADDYDDKIVERWGGKRALDIAPN